MKIINLNIHITTNLAKYIHSTTAMENDVEWIVNQIYEANNPSYVACYNSEGEVIIELGSKNIVPSIWTHTPVPKGFPIKDVHASFEKRASAVLGDYDTPVNLDKYLNNDSNNYNDYRYIDVSVRASWMMYLDLAIETFKTFNVSESS